VVSLTISGLQFGPLGKACSRGQDRNSAGKRGATLCLPEDAPSKSKGALDKILGKDDFDKSQGK